MFLNNVQLPNWARIRRLAILLSYFFIFICLILVPYNYDIFSYKSEIPDFSHAHTDILKAHQANSPSNSALVATIFTTFDYPNLSRYELDSKDFVMATFSQAHYQNTLTMMGRLLPRIYPIVFTSDPIAIGLALATDNKNFPITKKNVFGIPVLNQMFIQAMADSTSFFYGYTNGDMLYPRFDLVRNLDIIKGLIERGEIEGNVLIIGRRTNVAYLSESKVYTDGKMYKLAEKGQLYQPDAQDYIFVTKNSFDWESVPDFVVGRPAYDNWLIDFAYHRHYSIIDLTYTLLAIHQTGPDGIRATHGSADDIDRNWNYPLAREKIDHGTEVFAQFVSRFRISRRGNLQVKIWTLTHKQRPNFYFEVEYNDM